MKIFKCLHRDKWQHHGKSGVRFILKGYGVRFYWYEISLELFDSEVLFLSFEQLL